ncbi:MAG: hypothetical protein KTR26_22165 [Flammeovirgaceae bacterium]|nr:hypothetical protein [Flammeovirgaceae bacterium]
MSKINKLREKANRVNSNTEQKTSETFLNVFGQHDRKDIKIDPALQSFIPPLNEEEKSLLEESIRKEGIREDLLLWYEEKKGYILIDGHNRFEIIKKIEAKGEKVNYGVKVLDLPNFESVKDWMLINQLGRRNLTNEQRSYLRGLKYERARNKVGRPKDLDKLGQNDPNNSGKERVSEVIAKEFNVGEKTIRRDADFARGIEKIGLINLELKREILKGSSKLRKSILQDIGKIDLPPSLTFDDSNDVIKFITERKTKNSEADKKNGESIFSKDKKAVIIALQSLTEKNKAKDFNKIIKMIEILRDSTKN